MVREPRNLNAGARTAHMKIKSGIELLAETPGDGNVARKGCRVTYNVRLFLNRGDEVPMDARLLVSGLPADRIRNTGSGRMVDHQITLGKRQSIAGIEHTLMGMRAGGYRKVRIAPHLAYRDAGIPGLIPANAVLVVDVWLRCAEGA